MLALPTFSFACPFCGAACQAGDLHVGNEIKPGVTHALPMCPKFVELEHPADFLAAVNRELERRKS